MFFIILHRFNQHVLLQKPAPMSLLSNRFSWICDCLSGTLTDAIFYRHPRHPWGCFIVTVNVAWILKRTLQFAWQDPKLSESLCLIVVFRETTLSKYSYDLSVLFWTERLSRFKSLFKACLKHPYGQKNRKKKNPKEFYQNLKGSNQMPSTVYFIYRWFLKSYFWILCHLYQKCSSIKI